ncbi:hypothetical protein GCM10009772_44470 [Pseudonocardia alni subsp. carboxydivorans]
MWFTLERMYGELVSWQRCAGCGAEAELPGDETAGVAVPCPDCPGSMTEEFTWDAVAA